MAAATVLWSGFWPVTAYTNAGLHPAQTAATMAASSGASAICIALSLLAAHRVPLRHALLVIRSRRALIAGSNRYSIIFSTIAASYLPYSAVSVISTAFPLFVIIWMRASEAVSQRGTRITASTGVIAALGISGAGLTILSAPGESSNFQLTERPLAIALGFAAALASPIVAALSAQAHPNAASYIRRHPSTRPAITALTLAACGIPATIGAPLLLIAHPMLDTQPITLTEIVVTAVYGPFQATAFALMYHTVCNSNKTNVVGIAFCEAPIGVVVLLALKLESELNLLYLILGLVATAIATAAAAAPVGHQRGKPRLSRTPPI